MPTPDEKQLGVTENLKGAPGEQEGGERTGSDPAVVGLIAGYGERTREPTEISEEVPVPFAELKVLLDSRGIDLQKELDDYIQRETNRRGVVKKTEVGKWRAKFRTIHVRREELENLQPGQMPLLFIDDETPVWSARRLIHDAGIPFPEYEMLYDFKRFDPWTEEPRKNQTPSGAVRLTFITKVQNLSSQMTGRSADQNLKQMKAGRHFLQPQQWFELFRRGLETAMHELSLGDGKSWKDMNGEERQEILRNKKIDNYLPDILTWTQFPEWINMQGRDPAEFSGRVLSLKWDFDNRSVKIHQWSSSFADSTLGPRPVIG